MISSYTLAPDSYPNWVKVGTKFRDYQGTWRIASLDNTTLEAHLYLLDGSMPRNVTYTCDVAYLIQMQCDQMLEIVRIGGAA
jgi:hypothetical protein